MRLAIRAVEKAMRTPLSWSATSSFKASSDRFDQDQPSRWSPSSYNSSSMLSVKWARYLNEAAHGEVGRSGVFVLLWGRQNRELGAPSLIMPAAELYCLHASSEVGEVADCSDASYGWHSVHPNIVDTLYAAIAHCLQPLNYWITENQ
jgi:hypothetical protein